MREDRTTPKDSGRSQEILQKLFFKFRESLIMESYGILRDLYEAEDVVQETFIILWEKGHLDRVKPAASGPTYTVRLEIIHLAASVLFRAISGRRTVFPKRPLSSSIRTMQKCGKYAKGSTKLFKRYPSSGDGPLLNLTWTEKPIGKWGLRWG